MAKKIEAKYLKKLPHPFNKMNAAEFEGLTKTTPDFSLSQKASYSLFTAKKWVPFFTTMINFCFIFSGLCFFYVFYDYLIRPNPLLIASYPDGRLTCVTEHSTKDQGIRQKLNSDQLQACEAIESLKDIESSDSGDSSNAK